MSYTSLFYQVVFSTKDRRPFLLDDLRVRSCKYMATIAKDLDGRIVCSGGVPDHVHLVAAIPPTMAVAEFIGKIKSLTSGWIHRTFPQADTFDWQDGYAAFSVSPSVLPKLKRYIAGQTEHHRQTSFAEELAALLQKQGIEYDEKFLLG